MEIRELQKISHKQAVEKGFWGNRNRNKSELLMLIVSELGEACEALRTKNRQYNFFSWEKDTFEDELADTVIRIADLCEANDIDLEWQIKQKLSYNKTRPEKHGKEF